MALPQDQYVRALHFAARAHAEQKTLGAASPFLSARLADRTRTYPSRQG
jgi:hypothetical protein